MLAGKSHLTTCRNLRIVQVQARLTLTTIASVPSTYFPLCQSAHGRHRTNVPRVRATKDTLSAHHGRKCVTASRCFSTTSTLTLLPGKRERAYLQPPSKLAFRKRSKQEKDLFLNALKAAQDGHNGHILQGTQHNSGHIEANSDTAPEHLPRTPFSSPFFELARPRTSDHASKLHVQNSSSKATGPPKNFPPLSSLARSEVSTTDLEQELFYISHNNPHPIAIYNLLKILIHDRKTQPATQHYEALLLANCWPEYGSIRNVEGILMEMETEGIEIGASIIVAILRVLAIHPSPGLSYEMLGIAERRWLRLPPQTYHHLILGMIKTGQTELAAWTLDVLRTRSKSTRSAAREVIPDYLHVLLMAEMTKSNDWEGLLRYMYKLRDRKAADQEMPNEFWGWLLEKASKAARNVTESSQLMQGVSNEHRNQRQVNSATQRQRLSTNTHYPPDETTPESQTASTDPTHLEHLVTEPHSTSIHNSHLWRQISLAYPARYLVEHIWTLYVEPMSVRPSWTTCLNVLHIAAMSGTAWLADSTLAVMTYMDGVTEDGSTKTDVGGKIHELVRLARERHTAMEDPEAEQRLREAEREAQRKNKEYQKWWTDLMDKLDEGKDRHKARVSVGDEEKGIARSDRESAAQHTRGSEVSTADGKVDRHVAGLRLKEYATGERNSPPLANLWPAFPHINGVGSARVDPWSALGPRSSARGRWTEAQMFYKQQEKANRKK